MQEEKNVTTILIVSLLLLWIAWPTPLSLFFGGLLRGIPLYNLPPHYTTIELIWYFVNRLHILTFILTIAFAALHQTNIGRKPILYRLTVYLFIVSMASLFIAFAQMLIGLPYR